MKKLSTVLTTLLILVFAFPAIAFADTRCNGHYGITIYEHSNYNRDISGAKNTFCGTGSGYGYIAVSNLSNFNFGLSWGANWNDRLSSYQVFNAPSSTKGIRLYINSGYGTSAGYITTYGNDSVPDISEVGRKYNDSISSIKTTN